MKVIIEIDYDPVDSLSKDIACAFWRGIIYNDLMKDFITCWGDVRKLDVRIPDMESPQKGTQKRCRGCYDGTSWHEDFCYLS